MDSRERVSIALAHEEPDRVPFDFWASTGAWRLITERSGLSREEFLDSRDVDLRYIEGPRYTGRPLAEGVDIWGVRRRSATVAARFGTEVYSEVADSPLSKMTTVEEIEEYPGWPDPDDFDYSVIRAQAQAVQSSGRVAVFMGDRLNRIAQLKPAMYLRGIEQILLDLAESPEIAGAVISRISAFYRDYLTRILESSGGLIDLVLTGDDFGRQNGLLVSPQMWDRFLSPGFAGYLRIIHAFGAKSMHHTCGDVRLLAGRMSGLGLDVLQSLQPEAMGDAFPKLKSELGARLAFHGGISIQRTMPSGDPRAVEEEVRERINLLAAGGGYILGTAHNLQADCPYENITALLDAYVAHGRYRLSG